MKNTIELCNLDKNPSSFLISFFLSDKKTLKIKIIRKSQKQIQL